MSGGQTGHFRCTMCDLPITWDGGFQAWVHWEGGSIYCPGKTASVIGLPEKLKDSDVQEGGR